MSIQEHVILVNDQGMVIGTQEKYAAHTTQTPLHLAFSSWLFNAEGECLVTRRALSKKAWPGVWNGRKRQLSVAAAMRLAQKLPRLRLLPQNSATAKRILPGSWKTRFAPSSLPASPANCELIMMK